MTDGFDRQRLSELLEMYCDSALAAEDAAELNRLLEYEDGKVEYLKVMESHARLTRLLVSSNELGSPTKLASVDGRSKTWVNWGTLSLLSFSLAAVLVWGSLFLWPREDSGSFVARIIDKIDCDVEYSRWNSASNQELNSGQSLSVRKGLLSIEFGCGATVALQGPAEFKIVSDKKGFLEFGNLTAKAPPRAKGFTVETPTCTSVDLGTEFGMRVDATGISETHVFEGEVLLFDPDALTDDMEQGLRLTANQASRVNGDVESAVEIKANPRSFLRLPKAIDARLVANNVPFTDKDALKLWFDAGKYVETDESLRVVSWLDLTANGNEKSENAWQVNSDCRPFLIPEAINQRPAVRFMGQEYLVTEPVQTSDSITVFVVANLLPQQLRKRRFAGIFCSGSPYGIRLFRNPIDNISSKKPGYWQDGKELHSAWNVLDTSFLETPVVIGFVYDKENNRSLMSANGVYVKTGKAQSSIAMDKSFFIGSLLDGEERLVGDIAEILLFDSAMDRTQFNQVCQWLVNKYELDSKKFEALEATPVSVEINR